MLLILIKCLMDTKPSDPSVKLLLFDLFLYINGRFLYNVFTISEKSEAVTYVQKYH